MTESNQKHKHYSVILAWASGEDIEVLDKSTKTWKLVESPLFGLESQYRVQPKVITINGLAVPEPIRTEPSFGDTYWVEMLTYEDMVAEKVYMQTDIEALWLQRGLMHNTKEGALASAKARLKASEIKQQTQEKVVMG